MRSHAKASTAGSTKRQAKGFGRFFRGADTTRGIAGDTDGSGAPSLRPRLALLALAVALLLPSSANAAPPVTFATAGSDPSDTGDAGEIDAPRGIAVDQASGDVYIAENNNFRVDRFDSAGNFLLALGYSVADPDTLTLQTCGPAASPPTSECFNGEGNFDRGPGPGVPAAVAVDPSTGDVYVREYFRVERFSPDGEFLLMFGNDVNATPGTPHPNLCTAADVSAGDICVWGTAGAEPGEFDGDGGPIAVDPSGDLWVGGTNRLQRFNPDGTFASQIELPGAGQIRSLALDSAGNFYVKAGAFPGIRKLEAGTGALIETLDAGGQALTVTVDGSDNIYVGDATSPYRFKVYNPAGEQVSQFGAGQVLGKPGNGGGNAIAFGDTANLLYTINSDCCLNSAAQIFSVPEPGPLPSQERAEDVLSTTATLKAALNPENHETSYHFEYGTSDGYGSTTPMATLPGTGFEEEDVEAALDHLLPGTTYHFRLVATNHCNNAEPAEECTVFGEDTTFTTLPPARVSAQWATGVTSTSAVFHAELDPLGAPATWWFEHGLDESYGSSTGEKALGSGFGDIAVQVALDGLTPGTTYHYRFVVRDERDGTVYTVHGKDRTVTAQLSGLGFGLADNRAWEMVSPPNKIGASIVQGSQGVMQAAASGNAVAFQTVASIEENPDGNRAIDSSTVLSRRGADLWHSKDITPPRAEVTQLRLGGEYKTFSPNLERALLEPQDDTPYSPEASEEAPYLRENTEPAAYRPLVTTKEGYANVPPGTVFGGVAGSGESPVAIKGANPALTHVVLKSREPLVPGAAPRSLYAWTEGQLQPVSERPASEGGGVVFGHVGSDWGSIRHAVSADGSRVFWGAGGEFTSFGTNMTGLYVRDTVNQETGRLDIAQPGASGDGTDRTAFLAANADGTVVFFADTQQLTADARPGVPPGNEFNLYRCEVGPVEGGTLGCTSLMAVNAPLEASAEKAPLVGTVPGLSEDGTSAYFVATGVLDTGANQFGDTAVAGQPNLYLWQEGEGRRFIATLSFGDRPSWGGGGLDGAFHSAKISAASSPSGRYFAFMSERSLTGYDNRDAVSGEPVEEVFRYDAVADRLDCVSCNPSGASPDGQIPNPGGNEPTRADPQSNWSQRWVAAILPGAQESEPTVGLAFYYPRIVLENGRVFFNAVDSLVPADSNGEWDVYQYEPLGVGDCIASSSGAAIVRSAGGCVSLLSSGTAEEEASFLDASVTGNDVFFLTPARLSVLDEDSEVDVYDVRVDGVPATLPPNTECLGEACQPAAAVPNDPTPASASFKGEGNVKRSARKRCARGKRAVRRSGKTRCLSRKQKQKKRQKRSRAGKSGRASR